MKIVHVITRLILGGAQENTLISCRLLAERGHHVTLITGPAIGPEGELFEQTRNQKFETLVVDELRREIEPVKDFISYRKIKQHLRNLKPDIVHTHSAKAGVLGRFAGWSMKGKWGESIPGVIHTIHGLAFHPYQSCWVNRFYISIEQAAGKRTDCFISVADAMTEQAKQAGIGTKAKYTTAYSAIEEEDFIQQLPPVKKQVFRARYGIADDAVVLVTIARLFELKGHEYIIESARMLSQRYDKCVWLFVGDGNLATYFKKKVHSLALEDKVKFTGLLRPSEIPTAIKASDILVHCSLREGLARALPQAMLCGRPAVSFDVDGAREVVNEKTGRLIEPESVQQLINACAELIEDEQLRHHLGKQAREYVKEKFSPEKMIDTLEEVYFSITSAKRNMKHT